MIELIKFALEEWYNALAVIFILSYLYLLIVSSIREFKPLLYSVTYITESKESKSRDE